MNISFFLRLLAFALGVITVLLAFLVSYLPSILAVSLIISYFEEYYINQALTCIFKLVYSVVGTLSPPIFGIFLLGFFFTRVNNRVSLYYYVPLDVLVCLDQSALIAFFISLAFQLWVLIGATLTAHQQLRRSLPTSVNGCTSLNITLITPSMTRY